MSPHLETATRAIVRSEPAEPEMAPNQALFEKARALPAAI